MKSLKPDQGANLPSMYIKNPLRKIDRGILNFTNTELKEKETILEASKTVNG